MVEIRRGRRRKRSRLKELLLLLALKLEGPIGRYRLKEVLSLTEHEGLVRLMLEDLKNGGYASSSRAGSELTEDGERLLRTSLDGYGIVEIRDVDLEPLNVGPESVALHVRDRWIKVRSPISMRDAAVRAGAAGGMVIRYRSGHLEVPSVYPDLSEEHPELTKELLKLFDLSNGDTLIIGLSDDRWRALEGALSAAGVLSGSAP
ncbi:MAG: DUF4443 domain-containing protein [Candidatus Bathyarchaeia archaeon]